MNNFCLFFQTHVIRIFSFIRLNYIILIIFDFLNIKINFHIIYLKQHIILIKVKGTFEALAFLNDAHLT